MENIESPDNIYNSLKRALLTEKLTPGQVQRALTEMDQKTGEHPASEENIHFLLDPEIVDFINTQSREIQDRYKNFLSFTEFHIAQRKAIIENDQEAAFPHFKNALSAVTTFPDDNPWKAYVEGTFLYLEGKQIPEDMILNAEMPGAPNQNNMKILKDFNSGLKRRGYPSYNEDYPRR